MRKIFVFLAILFALPAVSANSMFDENGNYSGNWKQMTHVNTSSYSHKYSSSNYTTHSWKNYNKQKSQAQPKEFSTSNYNNTSTMPFRYNSLDYTRTRKVQGGHGEYNAKCTDIGDVSFCR